MAQSLLIGLGTFLLVLSNTLSNSRQAPAECESAIGTAEIHQLRKEFSAEGMRELVQMFRAEAPSDLERMAAAAERRDGEALRRAAHALRGAAANFGARPLDALCQKIEIIARNGDFANAASLLTQVREEYSRVEIALQNEC